MAEKPKLPTPKPVGPTLPKPTPVGPSITQATTNRGTPMRPTTSTTGKGVMGSSYVPGKSTFNPASLTLSNKQIEELIRQRSATTGTGKGTGIGTGTGKGTGTGQGTPAPLTFTDVDNGDGTITRTYSNGSVEILSGGKGVSTGGAEDPATTYAKEVAKEERRSAFQILADEFTQRGLPTLAQEVQNFMQEGLSPAEAKIAIRNTQAYKDRFKGNEGRIKKGLAVYQPDEYLAAEETYRNLLLANNLQDLVNKNTTDAFIAGAVSAQEVQDRIQNVFNRIDNADPALKSQLGQYFNNFGIADPNLQRSQLASALLTGETSSMALERQLKKAQLRAGAEMAGVTIAEPGIESLQKQLEAQNVSDVYGVAKTGFKTLAETQAEAQRLAGIYGGEQPPLAEELQQEAFFGLASQRRKKLQEKEQASFAGRAGTTEVSLGQAGTGTF